MQIRAFLINKRLNGRGWAINAATAAKNVLSYLGKPLILKRFPNGRIDHREWESSLSASKNMQRQQEYAIGAIKKILQDSSSEDYYADIDITNKEAEDWIRAQRRQNIAIAVSPQIIYDRRKEPDPSNITNWFGSHLAVVDVGAYGPSAIATNLCETECPLDIQKGLDASIHEHEHDFSIYAALDAAVTSQLSSETQSNHQMSMIEVRPDGQQQSNNQNMLIPSSPKEPAYIRDSPQNRSPVPISPPVPENQPLNKEQGQEKQQQPQHTEQNVDYKQLAESYKAELENIRARLQGHEELSSKLGEHEKKLAKYDAETKERAIRDAIPIFLPEFENKNGDIDYEKVDAEVKDYLKRNWTPDDVKKSWMHAVKAWQKEQEHNQSSGGAGCSCGKGGNNATAANASIFTVPSPAVEGMEGHVETKPWFVDAAKFMTRGDQNFSKRPWRVL